jgi:transposase-like protein
MAALTPVQSQVIAGLLAGKSVSAVARENGIHRSTIYEWRNEHPYFSLVLEQCRSRHQVNLYDLVQDLTEQTLETVGTMVQSEDANLRGADHPSCCRAQARPERPPSRDGIRDFRGSIPRPNSQVSRARSTGCPRIRHNPTESDS